MKANNLFLTIAASALLLLTAGCNAIMEDYGHCPYPYKLFIKALDADNQDITSTGEAGAAHILLFDKQGNFIATIARTANEVSSKKPIELAAETLLKAQGDQIHFVVLSNIDDKVECNIGSIKTLGDLYVQLKGVQEHRTVSPGYLFFGTLDVPIKRGGLDTTDDQEIEIRRKTIKVSLQVYGLDGYNSYKEGKYQMRLRKGLSRFDGNGTYGGNEADYLIDVTVDKDGNVILPEWCRTFPAPDGTPYTFEILFDGKVIYSADKDSKGNSFMTTPGRHLNIVIDFRGSLDVKIAITDWDEVYQYVIY